MKPEQEALICAMASEAIYGSEIDLVGDKSSQASIASLNPSNFVWIDLKTVYQDICAFIVTTAESHLLVFRGTKIFQDWMEDLDSTPARFDWVFSGSPSIGEIHAGFGHCLAEKIQEIVSDLAKRDLNKPLLISGHSLGGALAALAGAYFITSGKTMPTISKIYTFGQPRIGLYGFCNFYSRILSDKLIRFVNQNDVVPRVPFRGFEYSDEGIMIHFDSSGKPLKQSLEWQNFLTRTFQSFEDMTEIIKDLRTDVGDHSVTGYKILVQNNQPELALLLADT
jgi:hypothetical protein